MAAPEKGEYPLVLGNDQVILLYGMGVLGNEQVMVIIGRSSGEGLVNRGAAGRERTIRSRGGHPEKLVLGVGPHVVCHLSHVACHLSPVTNVNSHIHGPSP